MNLIVIESLFNIVRIKTQIGIGHYACKPYFKLVMHVLPI